MDKKDLKYYLSLLGIKSTIYFISKCLESINSNTLFGISRILGFYKIETECIVLNEKKDLLESKLDLFPAIICYKYDFLILKDIKSNRLQYIKHGKENKIELDEFFKNWDGTLLIAEKTLNSKEPYYIENSLLSIAKLSFPILFILFTLFMILYKIIHIYHEKFILSYYLLSLFFNIVGLGISILLLLKNYNIETKIADTICSTFSKGDCNSLIYSKVGKILGIVSWSEIGVAFFLSNILFIIGDIYSSASLFIILSIGYSIWSILYQFFKKKMCVLCLMIQIIILSLFTINCYYGIWGNKYWNDCIILNIIIYTYICFLIICFSNIVLKMKKYQLKSLKLKKIKESDALLNIYNNSLVLNIEIKKCPSSILFGREEASDKLIIILSPNCKPCIYLSKKLQKLYVYFFENIDVRIVLSSKNEHDLIVNCILLKEYKEKGIVGFLSLFSYLSECSTIEREKIVSNQNNDFDIREEILSHKQWILKNNINNTPMFILNEVKLPNIYQIEDIPFLCISK